MSESETLTIDTSKPPIGKDVVSRREGINAWGLYVEVIHYYKTTGKLAFQRRLLLVENTVSESLRRSGMKQARWKFKKYPTHDAAKVALLSQINKLFKQNEEGSPTGVTLRGNPVMLQLTEVDLDAVRVKDEAPFGRYAALHHVDKRLGKVDDNEWRYATAPSASATPTGVGIGVAL